MAVASPPRAGAPGIRARFTVGAARAWAVPSDAAAWGASGRLLQTPGRRDLRALAACGEGVFAVRHNVARGKRGQDRVGRRTATRARGVVLQTVAGMPGRVVGSVLCMAGEGTSA